MLEREREKTVALAKTYLKHIETPKGDEKFGAAELKWAKEYLTSGLPLWMKPSKTFSAAACLLADEEGRVRAFTEKLIEERGRTRKEIDEYLVVFIGFNVFGLSLVMFFYLIKLIVL